MRGSGGDTFLILLFHGVDTFAIGVEVVHKMHGEKEDDSTLRFK